ncbi:MAG: hypothetical protein ABIJ56_10360 [Pseudomonadota bacterium]
MSLLDKRLLDSSIITDVTYRNANAVTKKHGGTLPLNFVRINAIVEDDLLNFIKQNFKVPSVDQKDIANIRMGIINMVPPEMAERFRVLPFDFSGKEIKVVMSDPMDEKIIEEIAFIVQRKVAVHAALESVISWALLKYYGVITESGSELTETISYAPAPRGDDAEADMPIPLVTRKRPSSIPPPPEAVYVPEKSRPAEEAPAGRHPPEMGDWGAPFDLSRKSSPPEAGATEAKAAEKEESGEEPAGKRFRRKTPTKVAIPVPQEAVEIDFGESKKDETAARREEAQAIDMDDSPIVLQEEVTAEPEPKYVTLPPAGTEAPPPGKDAATLEASEEKTGEKEENGAVLKKQEAERRAAVSITPVRIIGKSSHVAETISPIFVTAPARPVRAEAPGTEGEELTTYPPPRPSTGAPSYKAIDRNRVDRWVRFIGTLRDTEKVIDRTLAFLDAVLGPTVFLRKKKDSLTPYRFSLSVPKTMHEKLESTSVGRGDFPEVWQCLDDRKFLLARNMKNDVSQVIVDINSDARMEARPMILIVPIVIVNAQVGAVISVPTGNWENTPDVQDTLALIESTLAKAFETIILEKKKGSHGR